MRVLITGAEGQVGQALQRHPPRDATLCALNRQSLDITDRAAVIEAVRAFAPEWIINAAAYTAVDRAESEPEKAFAINGKAVQYLAEAASGRGARLVYISTDFVFDGEQGRPYRADNKPSPCSVYGASKLEGEQTAYERLGDQALIVRTAWVYDAVGTNFVHTMLRLMRERDSLNVVADQVGTPTRAQGLAQALWALIVGEVTGLYHWTDAGVASWYDFALAIRDEALALGLLSKPIQIAPLPTTAYPTPAQRPAYSVLDKFETWERLGYQAPHWREALREELIRWASTQTISDVRS